MFRTRLAAIIIIALIFTDSPTLLINSSGDEEENIPEWGFYVYMAGDNSLHEQVEDDLNEMIMIGSNQNLEIVTLTDQRINNDSHAYHVTRDGLEETPLNQINNTWENELDMANKNTLRDFMIWASTNYTAEKKILVIWNHGSGWERVAEDKSNHLTVPEIRKALEEYRSETGDPPLTLIGFDACLMGMFEIAYELKDEAEMIHGSEAYEPEEGWTYNHLLYKLKTQMSNHELANHVVNDYIESYRNGSVDTDYSVTSAVIETSELEELWNELNTFSNYLSNVKPVYQDETEISRDETQRYDENPNYRDLYDLSVNIGKNIPVYDIQESAKKMQLAIDNAVIVEDHWQKCDDIEEGVCDPEKLGLPVDRAHGLTIYFPTDGSKGGYNDLRINDNKWYNFIEQYPLALNSKANFEMINAKSINTGTGYNDSVKINGSYIGDAEKVKIHLINNKGEATNSYMENVSSGNISDIYLQPTKSGNYILEIGLYDSNDLLEDHYILDDLYIDLRLPDLHVESPKILIEDNEGNKHIVSNLQKNDEFVITGQVSNIGTRPAHNVSLTIESGDYNYHFNLSEIGANESRTWFINDTNRMKITGNYDLELNIAFDNEFEIDSSNNANIFSFKTFDDISHNYSINSKNKNVLEIQTNENNDYEFPWLESYVTISNNEEQAWDLITIEAALPNNWKIDAEPFLHISNTTEKLVRIKPSIDTKTGEYVIELNMSDRNNNFAGIGKITINIPQYYGVKISAKQIDNYAEITIENSGNGNDIFIISKELEEGLTLYLPETKIELDGFEGKIIKTLSLDTEHPREYEATFTVQSEGNANITAEITMFLIEKNSDNITDNQYQKWIIGVIGLIAVLYVFYQRRIS